jgi:hypothetical protein
MLGPTKHAHLATEDLRKPIDAMSPITRATAMHADGVR